MALVRSLALSQGGGIISYNQQAKQEENIVNIFIGLGGTGVDCLREIKTQVYNRIEPDLITNDGKVVYEHIRFLGVDRDIMSFHSIGDEDSRCNCLPLFESEMFALAGSGITLKNVKRASDVFTQYAWLSDHIDQIGLDDYEPSGLRQEGRFLIMANADKFMARVQNVIADSKRGLCNPRVVIHIISGLGGATGSGIFLDVCYMLREILKTECNTGMCGYFFTPDVNVAHVQSNNTKKYIQQNGYAALQELDYCMNIEKNHGKFRQEYTGGTGLDTEFSDWRELPLLTPVSLLEDKHDRLPHIMCERVKASIKTCDDVFKYGIYSVTYGSLRLLCVKTELESELHRVSDEALACVNEFEILKEQDESADADVGIDKHKGLLSRKDMLIQKISEIRDGLSNKDYYEDTDYELIITGELYNDNDFMRIAKDELCYSPVMLLNAQKSITIIEKAYQTIEKIVTMLRYIK